MILKDGQVYAGRGTIQIPLGTYDDIVDKLADLRASRAFETAYSDLVTEMETISSDNYQMLRNADIEPLQDALAALRALRTVGQARKQIAEKSASASRYIPEVVLDISDDSMDTLSSPDFTSTVDKAGTKRNPRPPFWDNLLRVAASSETEVASLDALRSRSLTESQAKEFLDRVPDLDTPRTNSLRSFIKSRILPDAREWTE